ncbi:MAG: hypothetical protein SGPRY_001364 [Prymnesium sp.]
MFALRLFGFGPVVSDGFGIGYIIKDESISLCAASKHRQTERFLKTLAVTFNEMLAALKTVADEKAASEAYIKRHAHDKGPGHYGYFDSGEEHSLSIVTPISRHGRALQTFQK